MNLTKPEVAVYYYPQFHVDPRNEVLIGPGWTEWEIAKAARPRFPGHQQPITSAWGCFDESDPQWSAREIDLAADHGITAFLYDYYWYDNAPFLNGALDDGFLHAPNRERLKFALMWANHHWMNLFPTPADNKQKQWLSGDVTPQSFDAFTDVVVERYFTQPNYLKLGDEPYFSVFILTDFVNSIGGISAAQDALGRFREKARRIAGCPNIHLATMSNTPWLTQATNSVGMGAAEIFSALGIQSVTPYCFFHHYEGNPATFPIAAYTDAMEVNIKVWEESSTRFPVPFMPCVSMGWDPTSRCDQTVPYESKGYPWTSVLTGNTPEAFGTALERAADFIQSPQVAYKMVTINAWNEWTEGSYLLPDTVHGDAYLKQVQRVFGSR